MTSAAVVSVATAARIADVADMWDQHRSCSAMKTVKEAGHHSGKLMYRTRMQLFIVWMLHVVHILIQMILNQWSPFVRQ